MAGLPLWRGGGAEQAGEVSSGGHRCFWSRWSQLIAWGANSLVEKTGNCRYIWDVQGNGEFVLSQAQSDWSLQVNVEGLLGWDYAVGLMVLGWTGCCELVRSFLLFSPGEDLLFGHAPVVGWPGEPAAWSLGSSLWFSLWRASSCDVILMLTKVCK